MSLPDSVAKATLSHTFVNAAGAAQSGTVRVSPTVRTTVGETGITIDPVVATLDSSGRFSVTVAATDDTDIQPIGWAYTIVINVGREHRAFSAFLPAGDHDLADLTPVSPVDPNLPDVKTVNGIGPDEDGDVDLGAISAPVTSVAGKIGAVTLVKADVGLPLVDNTSDLGKPVSTATASALSGKSNTGHTHPVSDVVSLQATLDGLAPRLGMARAYITSGNINLNTGSPVTNAWEILPGSPTISIPAVVGDTVGLDVSIGRQANANLQMDLGVIVGGVIKRWIGNGGTTTPAGTYEGDVALYHTNIPSRSGERRFVVEAGDRDGSNVVFAILRRVTGAGSALVLLDGNNPGYWQATNYRQ